jgi:hypothetical protein
MNDRSDNSYLLVGQAGLYVEILPDFGPRLAIGREEGGLVSLSFEEAQQLAGVLMAATGAGNGGVVVADEAVYDRAVYAVLEELDQVGHVRIRRSLTRGLPRGGHFGRKTLMAIVAGDRLLDETRFRQVGPESRRILQAMIAGRPEFRGFPPCTCPEGDCPVHSPLED